MKPSDDSLETLLRQLKTIAIAGVVLFLLLTAYAVYLNRRLDMALESSSPTELEGEQAQRTDLKTQDASPVDGQTVYVPAYSHIYRPGGAPYLLTVTLSIRNTSQVREIVVSSVRYFDTKGQAVKSYLTRPVRLPALSTTEVVVEQDDTSGGSGANFLVDWHAKQAVSEPVIEAVMVYTSSQQALAFTCRGVPVRVAVSDAVPGQAEAAKGD